MWAEISVQAEISENPHVIATLLVNQQIIMNEIVINSLSGRIKKECKGRILDF